MKKKLCSSAPNSASNSSPGPSSSFHEAEKKNRKGVFKIYYDMNFVFAFISLPFSMVRWHRSGARRIKSFLPARTANCPIKIGGEEIQLVDKVGRLIIKMAGSVLRLSCVSAY
jgi:hypothetical protein